jgi:hypothetical protein
MGLSPGTVNRVLKEKLKNAGYKPDFPLAGSKPAGTALREYRKIPSARIVNRLHLYEYDEVQIRESVEIAPKRVELLMRQHIGSPAVPCVAVGDFVRKGDVIGDAVPGALGVPVHGSIDGKVTFADEERVIIVGG